MTEQNASGFVVFGDPGDDGCPGNTVISGTVKLTNNHADAEVVANDIPSLTLSGTSGVGPFPDDTAAEVEGNHVIGTVACTGDSPAPTNDGDPNTVGGARTGQCSAV